MLCQSNANTAPSQMKSNIIVRLVLLNIVLTFVLVVLIVAAVLAMVNSQLAPLVTVQVTSAVVAITTICFLSIASRILHRVKRLSIPQTSAGQK